MHLRDAVERLVTPSRVEELSRNCPDARPATAGVS